MRCMWVRRLLSWSGLTKTKEEYTQQNASKIPRAGAEGETFKVLNYRMEQEWNISLFVQNTPLEFTQTVILIHPQTPGLTPQA